MIRWLLLFLWLPVVSTAEPITIRSGEHATFSRLVVAIGEGQDWSINQNEDGYILEVPDALDGFDTGAIFDRLPEERLSVVSERTPNSLFLGVSCECYVDAFLWQPGQLVLDVVEGLDPEIDLTEPVEVMSNQTASLSPNVALPNLMVLRGETEVSSSTLEIPMALQAAPVSLGLRETEEALIAGLARAATQGFLDPAVEASPLQSEEILPVTPDEPQDLPGPQITAGQPGIGISTAMDREFALLGDALESTVGEQCLPYDLFEIVDWGNETDLHVQMAALAEGLAGEFGEEPREAQDKLARLYIYFGFGIEARAVLSTDPALSQERRILVELAGVVDDYYGPYPLIAAQAGCDTPGALWAFFVDPTWIEEEEKNLILQSFFALPQPLRSQVSSRLSQKFLEVNDSDSATKVLRATLSNDAETSHAVQTSRALIAEEIDDPDAALAVLSQEASGNARITPESLIRLIDLSLEQGHPIEEDDLILVATLREQYKDSPIAIQLAVAEAKGWSQLGQYRKALDLLLGQPADMASQTVNDVYANLTEAANSAEFLEFAYAEIPDDVSPETENEIARRLIDIGFPERASIILQGQASQVTAAERRYLRAEAAIHNEKFINAIDELLGLSNERARMLRAEAYAGLGEHRSALEAAVPNLDSAQDETMQFRAGAWERLTIQDDEALSDFAQAVLAPDVTEPAQTLADRRAILVQSQESRRAVEGLLLRFDGAVPSE